MNETTRREALENISLIKTIVQQTQREMSNFGGGWIAIIWGIYSYIGVAGHRWLIPPGPIEGIWWTGLTILGVFASYLAARTRIGSQPRKERSQYMRWFLFFWLPLLVLAYSLGLFFVFLPGLSPDYITVFILLVIATGYTMLGLLFFRDILYMGLIGMAGAIIAAVFFLEYSDLILGLLFGTGLIITGLIINRKWKD